MYSVKLSEKATEQFEKLDKGVQRRILAWLTKNLEGCVNPWSKGKDLPGDKAGQWRYRIADYRLICDIREGELIILALAVGHRKKICKGF